MTPDAFLTVLQETISHPLAMLMYGLATHFLKALAQIKSGTGNVISFRQYYLANPFQTALSFVGAFAGYGLLYGTDELTRASSFMMGYLADSAVDVIGQRSKFSQAPKE